MFSEEETMTQRSGKSRRGVKTTCAIAAVATVLGLVYVTRNINRETTPDVVTHDVSSTVYARDVADLVHSTAAFR